MAIYRNPIKSLRFFLKERKKCANKSSLEQRNLFRRIILSFPFGMKNESFKILGASYNKNSTKLWDRPINFHFLHRHAQALLRSSVATKIISFPVFVISR